MSEIDWNEAPEWADRVIKGGASNLLYWASDNKLRPVKGGASFVTNTHTRDGLPVVELRPARPIDVRNCRFVTTSVSLTIEQRIASLRALEKQVEEARAELTRDLESLGLTWMVRDEPDQPTITDWRDLRVGDVVEHVEDNGGEIKIGSLGSVCNLKDWGILVDYPGHKGYIYSCPENHHKFRFIRRP